MHIRYSPAEIRRAWVGLIDVHARIGTPSLDFLWNAIGTEGWGDGTTNDPAVWSDWLESLTATKGYVWADPIVGGRLWGTFNLISADGSSILIETAHGTNTVWPDGIDPGPVDGLSEVEGLAALDRYFSERSLAGVSDLMLIRRSIVETLMHHGWRP